MRPPRWLLIFLLVVCPAARAGVNVWTSDGPYGGSPGVVVSPARHTRLFAVASGRAFRSDDGGGAWTELVGAPSERIVPDVADPDVVRAPGYMSTDAGSTWSGAGPQNLGLGYYRLAEYVVDPRRPAIQYATLQAYWLHSATGAVVRSTDGGETWTWLRSGPPYGGLLLDATDPDTILTVAYLGTTYGFAPDTSRLVKSTDGGKTWRETFTTAGLISTLTADPRFPEIVYGGGTKGAYRSTDRGESWATLTEGRTSRVFVDPASSAVYLVTDTGLLKSPDWTPVGFGPGLPAQDGVPSLAFDATDPAIRYAGVYPYGVLKSVDGGATYAPASRGLSALGLAAVALSPASPGTLFATGGSVFRSDDGGVTWRMLPGAPTGWFLGSLVVDPGAPGTVYVAVGGSLGTSVHRTTDGGATWTEVLANLPAPSGARLLLDPRVPSTVYVAARDVFRSTDRGETWTQRRIPGSAGPNAAVRSLDLDPTGSILYAGVYDWGVLKSTDGGDTWSAARNGLRENTDVEVVLVDRERPATVFAISTYGGVRSLYTSTDAGASWSPTGTISAADPTRQVIALLQDPTRPATLYAATTAGVFRSPDRGASWYPDGLDGLAVTGLAYDASTFTLHASTARGLFRRTTENPVPRLTGLSPLADGKGNGGLTLTVTGTEFTDGSVVLWNGAPRPTRYVSATERAAAISGDDTASAGTAQVSVRNPAPGGGTSSSLTFTILDHLPAPSITGLSPASALASSPPFELHVAGTDFTFRSEVTWNGRSRATRFVSSSELVAPLGVADLAAPGTTQVAVNTPGGGTTASLPFTVEGVAVTRFLPIVLDAPGRNGSRYTSELTLVNRGSSDATLELTYVPSTDLGATGGGTVTETLPARRQVLIPDVLEHLRGKGLSIPREGPQGGSLLVAFRGLSSPTVVHASVRISNPSGDGKAGVAMPGLAPEQLFTDSASVFGLREDVASRSNLALVNAGRTGSITMKVTLVRGDGTQETALPPLTLEAGQWRQLGSVLSLAGFDAGWARIERLSGTEPIYAYGVVNDAATNDGSVVPGVRLAPTSGTVPVVVRTSRYESELVLANPGVEPITADLHLPAARRSAQVTLGPKEQKLIPRVVDFILGGDGSPGAPVVGPLTVSGRTPTRAVSVYAAARTTTIGTGGAFGVFTPAIVDGAPTEAWIYGLRNDEEVRSNLAFESSIYVQAAVELYSGETGEELATLGPYQLPGWVQLDSPLARFPVAHGWARLVNLSPWGSLFGYGVVNDRGTDDGSYLPMEIGGP